MVSILFRVERHSTLVSGRNSDRDAGSAAFLHRTLGPYGAAHRLDDAFGDGETQAGPGRPAVTAAEPGEFLEDQLERFGWDSRPLILHPDGQISVRHGDANRRGRSAGREFI